MTTTHLLLIIGNLACGLAGMFVWERKGGDPAGAFLLGAILGLLGLFILAVSSPRQKEIDRVARRRGLVSHERPPTG